MSSANTRIAEIVDQSAAIAAGITGIRSSFGAGSDLVTDPLHAPAKIRAAPPNPSEPFTHVSDLPSSANLALGMYGEDILTSVIPMRLFVDVADAEEARRLLVPFYPLYIAAFALTLTLNGTCRDWQSLTYRLGHDDTWAWLELALTVRERLVLTKHA